MVDPITVETLPFGVSIPPTQDELPYDDGVPMETQRHKLQMDILIDVLVPWIEQRSNGYVGGNMFLYFSMAQVRNQDFKGPDFFAVLDVPKGERKSWVVWEEGKAPDVVIELLSPSTAEQDKTEKKLVYQNQVRVPEYFWYDPFNPDDFAGFILSNGEYQPLSFDDNNRLISQHLGLALVRWQGVYKMVETTWLRWATLDGVLLPTGEELALQQLETAQEAIEAAQEVIETTQQNLETTQQNLETTQQNLETTQQNLETTQQSLETTQQSLETTQEELEMSQQRSQELEELLNRYRNQFGDLNP